MILYAISGLGADERVFKYLKLDYKLVVLNWLQPKPNEKISQYALRMSEKIQRQEKFGILGVSFGGLIATEISKQLHPEITILISSVETKFELRSIYRFIGKTKILNFLPECFFNLPASIAYVLFGAKQKQLLTQILNDSDPKITKWALQQLTTWNNETVLKNPIKICGTIDRLMPKPKAENIILIAGGAHFMIVDKAEIISNIIIKKL
ncbi:MAG: alpha/beta hydrolase [Bacteroidota bacterium]